MLGPLSYIGGKRALANQIIATFPQHTTYVEAFAGGAQVLFRKEPSKVEVLNDLSGDVINFFRVCQQHYEELARYLRFTLVSLGWFEQLSRINPSTLTDIQRAARFFYLQKNSFAGLVVKQSFGGGVVERPGYNPERIAGLIEAAHHRLARVQIEMLPYEQVLARYDRATTLFYLDPPYFKRRLYRYNFAPEDFVTLAQRMKQLNGKVVLSLNDVPEVRTIFREFKIKGIDLFYTAQKQAGKRFRELLITNF
jgi:DNA adenine methylase